MSKEQKPHFWIPDEEVEHIPKTPQGRSKPSGKIFSKHGRKLSRELESVKQSLIECHEDDSFGDSDLCVFKVELLDGIKVQDQQGLFDDTGLNLNVVRDMQRAIVSTSRGTFRKISDDIDEYSRSGKYKTRFDYIESFSPLVGDDKSTSELKKTLIQLAPNVIDIQLMLIPNLRHNEYESALRNLLEKIKKYAGDIQDQPYYLSDNTPVVRVIIPSSTLSHYENDSAIYRIEGTRFFRSGDNDYADSIPLTAKISSDIDLDNLPIVAVLDSGVSFSPPLSELIVDHWKPEGTADGDTVHGTKVAGKIVCSNFDAQLQQQELKPRAKILDCCILDGEIPENTLIKRIQSTVNTFADSVKIYNLSLNSSDPIEGDEMSIVGYELDVLQNRKKVQFVVSAGNHDLWKTQNSLTDILDDDDSRVSPPADSMLSIVVGTVIGNDYPESLSQKNQIAPYSRRGPGFAGFFKPDITAYGGTVVKDKNHAFVPRDQYSSVILPDGKIVSDCGTSFSAPDVAGALAEIYSDYTEQDILLAKALLYHCAVPIWENETTLEDDDLAELHNLYGRGVVSVEDSRFSKPSKVTFVRTGMLNKLMKDRIKIYMPDNLAALKGNNTAKVTVTCLSQPPVDRTKGSEYLGAYIRASIKKSNSNNPDLLDNVPLKFKEGRRKWDVCHHFSRLFSRFSAGDWQIWLEMFSRWEEKLADLPYALVVTIEDMSESLDIYQDIASLNRYSPVNTIRIKVKS